MVSPVRILHVVVNMNRGGAETLIMNIYRNIDRTKVQFDFLTCKEGAFDPEIIEMGGIIHRVPYVTEVGHNGYIKALKNFFYTHSSYKIVHSHMDKMSGLILRIAKKANIPIRIAHSHSTQSEGALLAKIYKGLIGMNINKASTHSFACSEAASDWLFGEDSESRIIKNGVDLTKFVSSSNIRNQVRYELGIEANTFVVGHVGRFSHPKNHTFLVDIFKEYLVRNSDSKMILIGDGPLRKKIERKIKTLGIEEKVKLLGIRSDIHELIQAFDIFVFPSLYEGLPVSLIEAQAVGIPCLVSTNVSREVDSELGLVHFLKLDNKSIWIDELTLTSIKRNLNNLTHYALKEKGYDIVESAKSLEEYYLKIYSP